MSFETISLRELFIHWGCWGKTRSEEDLRLLQSDLPLRHPEPSTAKEEPCLMNVYAIHNTTIDNLYILPTSTHFRSNFTPHDHQKKSWFCTYTQIYHICMTIVYTLEWGHTTKKKIIPKQRQIWEWLWWQFCSPFWCPSLLLWNVSLSEN